MENLKQRETARRVCPNCLEIVRTRWSWAAHKSGDCLLPWHIVAALSEDGGMTLRQLGRRLGREYTSKRALGMLRKLVTFGYVAETVDESGVKTYRAVDGSLIAIAFLPRVPKWWLSCSEVLRCL